MGSGPQKEDRHMTTMPRGCPECGATADQPHVEPCSFHDRYQAACGPVAEWLASLPAEYERLKARSRQSAFPAERFDDFRPTAQPAVH